MNIRNYNPDSDYQDIEALYKEGSTFGGEFDVARDTKERIDTLEQNKPDSVLVAEEDGKIVGTVTLFEDGRSVWLYRFATITNNETEITRQLFDRAKEILKMRGHTQVLVYAPTEDNHFEHRYSSLGFNKGGDFTAYWQDIV